MFFFFFSSHVLAVATIAEDDDHVNKADNYAKPTITIYDLKSLSLKQVFVEPDEEWKISGPRRFTKIRYLYDNVYMVALLVIDGSECVLYFYSWRNSTVDMYVRVDGFVTDVSSLLNIKQYTTTKSCINNWNKKKKSYREIC